MKQFTNQRGYIEQIGVGFRTGKVIWYIMMNSVKLCEARLSCNVRNEQLLP
jgi:hypothetical protein